MKKSTATEHKSSLLQAINTYFDAIYFADENLLDQVFHPTSSLFDADEGKIFTDPIASFRKDVKERAAPSSIKQSRSEEEIILIDHLSSKSAVVKLRLRAFDNIFADHLNFVLDENNAWKIVAKVWHLERIDELSQD